MATVLNEALSGFTVTYTIGASSSDVIQFGGSDATYDSTPPQYSLHGEFIYDDSGRAVIATRYTLSVQTIVYETTEALMAFNMAAFRRILSHPGGRLRLDGMGSSFGLVADLANGPKPQSIALNPLGQLAWECVWTVQFTVTECSYYGTAPNGLAWLAFNFNTTWQNDFEGLSSRTISGYAQIQQSRNYLSPKTVVRVADEVRDYIQIVCPQGWKRISNNWSEPDDKSRIYFVVTDEQLKGDPPPPGCTLADGSFDLDFGEMGFATATASMSMTVKLAPGVPREQAGIYFFTAALSKQAKMAGSLAESGGAVIPLRFRISNRKYDEARVSSFSMSWTLTKCMNEILKAAEIWEPFREGQNGEPTNYELWRASMQNLWHNRGTDHTVRSTTNDAIVIDLCSGVTEKTISGYAKPEESESQSQKPQSLTCPDVGEDGGWLRYDIKIEVLRNDHQTTHRKAKAYVTAQAEVSANAPTGTLGGPTYEQSAEDQHVQENHGFPDTFVALRFVGLRYKREIVMPVIRDIGGIPAIQVTEQGTASVKAYDIFTCPVYYMNGYRIYKLAGYVPSVAPPGSKVSCKFEAGPTATTGSPKT